MEACGHISKNVYDSVKSSYTGNEMFQRLGEREEEMINIEKDLHKALIKNVQHKRRTISRMMHIGKAVAFDTFLERIYSQSESSPMIREKNEALSRAQQLIRDEADRRKQRCQKWRSVVSM